MPIYLNGLLLGLSLIMTLGPQNIFLIKQGAMRNHAIISALTCFVCDIILITASVIGLQDILQSHDNLRSYMIWFGSLFLMYYGINALKTAWKNQSNMAIEDKNRTSRMQNIMLALGFSILNPHAIIDTFILIGGGSGQFPGQEIPFLFGVLTSSFLWFTLLTFLAYYFSKILTRAKVWRCVELGSGILLIALSIKLALSQF